MTLTPRDATVSASAADPDGCGVPAQTVEAVTAPDHHRDGGLVARLTLQQAGAAGLVTPPPAARNRSRGQTGIITRQGRPQLQHPRTDQRQAETLGVLRVWLVELAGRWTLHDVSSAHREAGLALEQADRGAVLGQVAVPVAVLGGRRRLTAVASHLLRPGKPAGVSADGGDVVASLLHILNTTVKIKATQR